MASKSIETDRVSKSCCFCCLLAVKDSQQPMAKKHMELSVCVFVCVYVGGVQWKVCEGKIKPPLYSLYKDHGCGIARCMGKVAVMKLWLM